MRSINSNLIVIDIASRARLSVLPALLVRGLIPAADPMGTAADDGANVEHRDGAEASAPGAGAGGAPPMPKLAALREAQSWLRGLTESERDRLSGTGAAGIVAAATRGQALPRRGREVVEARAPTPAQEARPYDHPYYWAAFVLFGDGE